MPYEVFRLRTPTSPSAWPTTRCGTAFCRAIGREDLVKDPRFDTEAKRVTNRETLVPLLNETFGARPADEWLARLEKAGVPAGRIKTVAEVCESAAPQGARHGGLAPASEGRRHHGDGRADPALGHPGRPRSRRPPLLGQHTDEILTRLLRVTPARVAKLRAAGVV